MAVKAEGLRRSRRVGGGSWLRGGKKRKTRPEERGNETGKVAIAHGSVEFCEATPIGLADES